MTYHLSKPPCSHLVAEVVERGSTMLTFAGLCSPSEEITDDIQIAIAKISALGGAKYEYYEKRRFFQRAQTSHSATIQRKASLSLQASLSQYNAARQHLVISRTSLRRIHLIQPKCR